LGVKIPQITSNRLADLLFRVVFSKGTSGPCAFDPDSGKEQWRTYTIPAPGDPGSETWPKGDQWRTGGGSGTGAHVRCVGKGRKERCTPLALVDAPGMQPFIHHAEVEAAFALVRPPPPMSLNFCAGNLTGTGLLMEGTVT